MCRWLDVGEDDAAIERTLYRSTASSPDPTPQSSPAASPQPAAQPQHALTLPPLPTTQMMLSPVPEQGSYLHARLPQNYESSFLSVD